MTILYDKDGNYLRREDEAGWSYSQKRNREGTGKLELSNYPHGAKYASLYKGPEKIKDVVITENSAGGDKVNTSIRTLESLFKNYRLPENWHGWDKKPLNHVLADAIYGFDFIRKTTLEDFTNYLEKVNIDLNKIKDGDIHLAYRPLSEELYKQILEKQKEEKEKREKETKAAENPQAQAAPASIGVMALGGQPSLTEGHVAGGAFNELTAGQLNTDIDAFLNTEVVEKGRKIVDDYIKIGLPEKIRDRIEPEKPEKEKLRELIEKAPILLPPTKDERHILDKLWDSLVSTCKAFKQNFFLIFLDVHCYFSLHT